MLSLGDNFMFEKSWIILSEETLTPTNFLSTVYASNCATLLLSPLFFKRLFQKLSHKYINSNKAIYN